VKLCSTCRIEKQPQEFNKRALSVDGLNSSCKVCRSNRRKTYVSEKLYNKDQYWKNPEAAKLRKEIWAKDNAEHISRYKRTYRKREPVKHLLWDTLKANKRKQRVPVWLSEDQRIEIEKYYWLAKDLKAVTGEEYQVDHIVPLNGKNVCGLHVPWNLQILPADINNKKSNYFSEGQQ
jgi:hypothetical protein